MRRPTHRDCVPRVESLDGRVLPSIGFVVGGDVGNPVAPGTTAQLTRVDPANGATTLLTQFLVPVQFSLVSKLAKLDGVALAPDGSLIAVGRELTNNGQVSSINVMRVDTATGNSTILTQFIQQGFNVFPTITRVDGLAVAPDGGVIVVGPASSLGVPPGTERVVRVDPTTGTQTIVSQFQTVVGFNTVPVLTTVTGAAAAPDGAVILVGLGAPPTFGPSVVNVVRVDPVSGTLSRVVSFAKPVGFNVAALIDTADAVAVGAQGEIYVGGSGVDRNIGSGGTVPKLLKINPITSAVTVMARFHATLGPALELSRIDAIAFAPVQGAVVVAGVRRFGNVLGTSDEIGMIRLVRVDATTGARSLAAEFTMGPGQTFRKLVGVAAGRMATPAVPGLVVHASPRGLARKPLTFKLQTQGIPVSGEFLVQADWNGDGKVDATAPANRRLRFTHTSAAAGRYTVAFRLETSAGEAGPWVARQVTIRGR